MADEMDMREEQESLDPGDAVTQRGPETIGGDGSMVGMPEIEPAQAAGGDSDTGHASLLEERGREYRGRWERIQTGFVDRPRESVEDADRLVVDVVQQLQATFTEERDRLESQWRGGSDVSTEDLRMALQRYHSFFDRLLSA